MNGKKLISGYKVILMLSFLGAAFFMRSGFVHADNRIRQRRAVLKQPVSNIKCNQFTFDATDSFDPDNETLSFFWDFGDGQTSRDSIVTHTYNKSGNYTITLTVTDNSGMECNTAVASRLVEVNLPPHVSFEAEEMVCTEQEIIFDASASYDDSKNRLNYDWDFGDGTTARNKPRVAKSYSKGGKYTASLTIDDNCGTVCSSRTEEKIIHVNEPPVAEAGEDTILKCISEDTDIVVNFDASQSFDVNNDKLNFEWDFGDGSIGQGVKISHSYSEIGNYDVKLIVKDNTNMGCGTSVDFITVKLNRSPQADAGEDVLACPGESLFFDGTNSQTHKKGTLSSKWFFGDGKSANGLKVTHKYSKPGKYQANLEIKNSLNRMCPASRDTRNVIINSTPTVSLSSVESVCLGNEIYFDASSAVDPDGDSLEYYWSFGDGNILKGDAKTSHKYSQGGNYKVTIIVDDGNNTACSTATALANVKVNTPPVADAGADLSCCVGCDTMFNASASSDPDGDRIAYTWNFGDGTKASGVMVNHKYTKSGEYNVLLTVDDNSGTPCSKSTTSIVAKVNTRPVPVINIK